MSFHSWLAHFFLVPNDIAVSGYNSLSFHILKDIWGYRQVLAFQIKLLQTFVCRFWHGHKFQLTCVKYNGVGLLDCVVRL